MTQTNDVSNCSVPTTTGPEPASQRPHLVLVVDAASERADLLRDVAKAVSAAETGQPLLLALRNGSGLEGDQSEPVARVVHQLGRWEKLLRRIERVPAPVVAIATGVCSGPAAEALLVADHRVVTADFVFRLSGGAPAQPTMAVHRLSQQLGVGAARQLVLWGKPLSATEALRAGIVDDVAPDLVTGHERAAARLRMSATRGADMAVCRRLLLDAAVTDADVALGAHLAALDRLLRPLENEGKIR